MEKLNKNSIYGEFKPNSEPSETPSEPSEHEYGCPVCKHMVSCEPNPFGICSEFERDKEK